MEIINHNMRCKLMPKTVSAELPYSYRLSDEQLQYYRENGFLIIRELIGNNDLNKFKAHFIRICKDLESTGNMTVVKERSLIEKAVNKEDYINKVQDIQFDDVFMTYSEHPLILDVVAQLIGDDISVINSMFINKPPGSSEHPPHQDFYYFPFRPADKIIGTWTAIDDVTVQNGCLWAVPGSHKDNTLRRHTKSPGALKLYHGIADETVAPPHKRVPLEMAPGDTVLINSLLVHGSGGNISKNYRKCLSTHYMNSHCQFVDVRGTEQENIGDEVEAEFRRRGCEDLDLAVNIPFILHLITPWPLRRKVGLIGTSPLIRRLWVVWSVVVGPKPDWLTTTLEPEAAAKRLVFRLSAIWRLKRKEVRKSQL